MIRNALAPLAVLALIGCAGQGAPSAADAPSSATDRAALIGQGRTLAETHCSSCHAIGETGESRFEPAPPFRTLSERYPVLMLEEAFAEGVLVGHPAMPEFRLPPEDIDALVAYLESIQMRRGG